ncbi:hypothetical protein ACEPPN_014489 [Leptodophora sp. 'Broadleaf-Isolate-01']
MKAPGAPRKPLGEVSPNQRSRVVSARDHGIPFPVIARMEDLGDTTCRSIVNRAPNQVSCHSAPRKGAPSVLTPSDHRAIRRAIVVNPKITAQQLFKSTVPHASKKTVYRYLLKSGIQKWRCKKSTMESQLTFGNVFGGQTSALSSVVKGAPLSGPGTRTLGNTNETS